jgi:hypothetical protein
MQRGFDMNMLGFAIPWFGGVIFGLLSGTGYPIATVGAAIAVVCLDVALVDRSNKQHGQDAAGEKSAEPG